MALPRPALRCIGPTSYGSVGLSMGQAVNLGSTYVTETIGLSGFNGDGLPLYKKDNVDQRGNWKSDAQTQQETPKFSSLYGSDAVDCFCYLCVGSFYGYLASADCIIFWGIFFNVVNLEEVIFFGLTSS